jgi:hypothetical protein
MPICRTRGRYRKQMRRYSKVLYNQRNKDETIVVVPENKTWKGSPEKLDAFWDYVSIVLG